MLQKGQWGVLDPGRQGSSDFQCQIGYVINPFHYRLNKGSGGLKQYNTINMWIITEYFVILLSSEDS